MSAFSKQAGTWTPIKSMYGKVAGAWTLVQRAFVNVNGTWTQFFGDNKFEVYSLGLEQSFVTSADKGLWMNGALVSTAARSYNVIVFDKYGNITSATAYDIFADGVNYANAGSQTQLMIAALAAIPAGTSYVIYTYDEPSTNAGNIKAALTSLFAGNTSILTSSMAYRGAYLAMGQAQQAPALEVYCGTFMDSVSNSSATTVQADEGCLDAVMHYTFRIYNGQIVNIAQVTLGGTPVVNGHSTGAPTVTDLG
jgi:hypothetical protein